MQRTPPGHAPDALLHYLINLKHPSFYLGIPPLDLCRDSIHIPLRHQNHQFRSFLISTNLLASFLMLILFYTCFLSFLQSHFLTGWNAVPESFPTVLQGTVHLQIHTNMHVRCLHSPDSGKNPNNSE